MTSPARPGRLSEPQAGVDRGGHDRIMTGRSLNRRVADLVLVSEDLDRLVREGPMSNFDIDVTRDGGWWMVHIPKLGGRTQARYPSEVEPMAREYIALSTGTPIDQVAINWRGAARCDRGSRAEHNAPHEDPHGAYGGVGNGGHHAIRAGTTA